MNQIFDIANKLLILNSEKQMLERMLSKDYSNILRTKIKEISKQEIRGRILGRETRTVNLEELAIMEFISKREIYDLRNIKWGVDIKNGVICVTAEYSYGGDDCDGHVFYIPADEDTYNQYIKDLTNKADKREKAIKRLEAREKRHLEEFELEEFERKELKRLRDKYIHREMI